MKSLAFNALERLEKNKSRNKTETNIPILVSRPMPFETKYETKNSVYFSSSSSNIFHKDNWDFLRDECEERIAIAEYDGNQTPLRAERIAYLDAFISILCTLTEDDSHQDWLAEKIQSALRTLEIQTEL